MTTTLLPPEFDATDLRLLDSSDLWTDEPLTADLPLYDNDVLVSLESIVVDQSWKDDALCAQTDPEAFFPEKGGSTRAAKAICATCPVITNCLSAALDGHEEYGVWGGKSPKERHKILNSRAQQAEKPPAPAPRLIPPVPQHPAVAAEKGLRAPSKVSQLLTEHRLEASQVRSWAQSEADLNIPVRGTLSLKSVQAYLAAHASTTAA